MNKRTYKHSKELNERELRNVIKKILITEIGQTHLNPYKYYLSSSQSSGSVSRIVYRFETEENYKYSATIVCTSKKMEVNFSASSATGKRKKLTGAGKPGKVVQTVINITKEFLKSRLKDNTPMPAEIVFSGMTKENERTGAKKRSNIRTRLYLRFIKTQFPQAQVKHLSSNKILVTNFEEYVE